MKKLAFILLLISPAFNSFSQTSSLIQQLNKRAIPVDSNLCVADFTGRFKGSRFLKELNSKRALGLGEATHGTHEFFVAKANLIKQLLRVGHFDRIGLEAPYAEVENLNIYITGGNGDPKEVVKSFRQYTYETAEFIELINQIRSYDETAKVKVLFYGYDFQSPYKTLATLRSAIKDPHAISVTDSLISDFNGLSNALYGHGISSIVYKELLRKSEEMYKSLSDITDPITLKSLKNYRQFLVLNDPQFSNGDLVKISEIRDSTMAMNVLNEIKEGHSMLVWAHNAHVQKTANVWSKSMGQFLAHYLKSEYATIGLATYEGFYTGYNNTEGGVVKSNKLVLPRETQIEYYLKQATLENYVVRTSELKVPPIIIEHRLLGYGVTDDQFKPGNLIDAFDYIIFISRTTGSLNYYLKSSDLKRD